MSRAYRVNWVTASSTVTTSDTLTVGVSLLGILPEAEMAAMLRDELTRAGWSRGEDGTLTKALGELTATLDAGAAKVTVTASAENAVSARGRNKGDADTQLVEARSKERERLLTELAKRLSAAEPDLRAKMGEAVQRVYVEALRKKAASMGTIESVHEGTGSDGEYEVTIKVRT
jgi:hypothetical protein